MAGATNATLGAGTTLAYESVPGSGTYVNLPNALNIGEVGEEGEFAETTPIANLTREYIPGLQTPPDKGIVFNDLPGDAAWQAFEALVQLVHGLGVEFTQ